MATDKEGSSPLEMWTGSEWRVIGTVRLDSIQNLGFEFEEVDSDASDDNSGELEVQQ